MVGQTVADHLELRSISRKRCDLQSESNNQQVCFILGCQHGLTDGDREVRIWFGKQLQTTLSFVASAGNAVISNQKAITSKYVLFLVASLDLLSILFSDGIISSYKSKFI